MTDSAIARLLLKENFKETFNHLEKNGSILYLNNNINKWLLSIFIQGISELYSNFIWDLFLLEGNIIIFKAIYAIFKILEKDFKKKKTFEHITKIFNDTPLKFNNRGRLAYYLIGKKFNFNMDIVRKHRKTISSQIIKEIIDIGIIQTNEKEEDKKEQKIVCDLDWPICVKDKKNLERDYDYTVLKELEEPNVIEDYLDNYNEYKDRKKVNEYKNINMNFINDDDIESQKIKYFKGERFKDILIERKKHNCGSDIMSIRSSFSKSEKNNDKGSKNINIINYFKENKKDNINIINNVDDRDRRINRIITHVSIGSQYKISFVKEKEEKISFIDDDKK